MTTGNLMMRKWRNITPNLINKTLNLTISRQWSKIWCIRIKIRIIFQTIWINHMNVILPLWSHITRRLYHWKVEILQKWLFVDSQTWDQLTKVLWTPHQYRTQVNTSMDIKNFYNHMKYVSKYGDYTLIRPSFCLLVHQKTLWVLAILCPILFSSSTILEYKYLQLPWPLPFMDLTNGTCVI